MKFSHTGCSFRAQSRDSVFLFLPDSATLFFPASHPLCEFLPKVYSFLFSNYFLTTCISIKKLHDPSLKC